jgi:hypothetical protein
LEKEKVIPNTILLCDTHPDRWNWKLIKLVWVWWWSLSFSDVLKLIEVSYIAPHSYEELWMKFISSSWFGELKVWSNRIIKTNNTIYYTTLSKNFWKKNGYTYEWCVWWLREKPVNSYRYWGISLKRRMKRSVPVFWRNCLPVQVENNTVQEVYSLIR